MNPRVALATLACLVFPRTLPARRRGCSPSSAVQGSHCERSLHFYNTATRHRDDPATFECWRRLSLAAADEAIAASEAYGYVRHARPLIPGDPGLTVNGPEVAHDLDAYRAWHPRDGAADPLSASVLDAERLVRERVARIVTSSPLPGARVSVRRVDAEGGGVTSEGGRVHYVVPGAMEFFVTAPRHGPITRRLHLPAGDHTLVVDESASPATAPAARARPLRPWILPSAIAAGSFAALGVAFTPWRESTLASQPSECTAAPAPASCLSAHGALDADRDTHLAEALSGYVHPGLIAAARSCQIARCRSPTI